MPTISKSARLFRERAGIRPTIRRPIQTLNVTANSVLNASVEPPLPLPETLSNGDPAPDRGLTKEPWPHGTDCTE